MNNKNYPIEISNGIISEISAGLRFSLAITSAGELYGWGSGQYGQLGDNATVGHLIATQVGTNTDWKKVDFESLYLPGIAVDTVIFGFHEGQLMVLLLKYENTNSFS